MSRVRMRVRLDQPTGVFVFRVRQNVACLTHLDDTSLPHDRDSIRYFGQHGQLMGNEENGDTNVITKVSENSEQLRLHRDVQGAH
jgi:hypothetical protein